MFTVVNSVTSNNQNITCGVPQGSTLGPLLFTLYVNDLPLATNFDVKLFADDTNLTMSNYNVKDLQKNVNNEIENIIDWMRSNKLSLNFTKTEFLLITKAKRQKSFEIKINGHAIQPSSYEKYLGVNIDDNLTWKKHVNTVCSKIGKGCWALARLRTEVESMTQGSRPRPRQTFWRPRPRTEETGASALQKKRRFSKKFFKQSQKKGVQKFFSGERSSNNFFSGDFHLRKTKKGLRKVSARFLALSNKILMVPKIVLSSSRGQGNFRGLEASRPRTSKCGLEDVFEAKDVLEDSTSGYLWTPTFCGK